MPISSSRELLRIDEPDGLEACAMLGSSPVQIERPSNVNERPEERLEERQGPTPGEKFGSRICSTRAVKAHLSICATSFLTAHLPQHTSFHSNDVGKSRGNIPPHVLSSRLPVARVLTLICSLTLHP